MENIPYYDFTDFPVKSEMFFENIITVIDKGIHVIFINFGPWFPWSFDKKILSEFAYPEKLLEKIDKYCSEKSVELIPVLSVLTECSYILKEKRYEYLSDGDIHSNGIKPSATGAGKFIEGLIEDIYSILCFSKYLLLELPPIESLNLKDTRNLAQLIERLADYLKDEDKNLLIGCDNDFNSSLLSNYLEKIPIIIKRNEKGRLLQKGNFYKLKIITETITLMDSEYRLIRLSGNEGFIGKLDPGLFATSGDLLENFVFSDDNEIKGIDNFLQSLEKTWLSIRICHENFSLILRGTTPAARRRFLQSVGKLTELYLKLEVSADEIMGNYRNNFQPGILKIWIDTRIDPISIQMSELKITSERLISGS